MAKLVFLTAAARASFVATHRRKQFAFRFRLRLLLALLIWRGVSHVADIFCAFFQDLSRFANLLTGFNFHVHQNACDFVFNGVEQLTKEFKSFSFVFLLRLLLRVTTQVNALAQIIQRTQVLAPVGVDALQQNDTFEGHKVFNTDSI